MQNWQKLCQQQRQFKMFFREMLDEKSSISNLRFIALIIAINGVGILWYGSIENKDTSLVGLGMLSLALTGKVIQKAIEVRNS